VVVCQPSSCVQDSLVVIRKQWPRFIEAELVRFVARLVDSCRSHRVRGAAGNESFVTSGSRSSGEVEVVPWQSDASSLTVLLLPLEFFGN
jgi:hypothetical protein